MKNKQLSFLSVLSTLLLASCAVSNTSVSSTAGSSSINTSSNNSSANASSEEDLSSEEVSEEDLSIEDSSSEKKSAKVALESTPEYFKLFNPETPIEMELSISDEVSSIISYYQGGGTYDYTRYKDFYFPGDFKITIDGEVYNFQDVGVRMKGNLSRHEFVDYHTDNIYSLVNLKISFKETFDDENLLEATEAPTLASYYREWTDDNARKERKDRNLFGLEKLDLKVVPRNDNNCFATEIYAYDAFRDNGLISPRANIGNFTLKNETSQYAGAMELIEPVDKQLIKRNYSKDDSKGDLYKCVYKSSRADFSRTGAVTQSLDENGYNIGTREAHGRIGVEDPFNGYIPTYQLKTNDKNGESSDFSNMVNLINAVWSTSYGGAPLSMLDEVLDINQFLKFSAVSYLLGGFDDQRYNYNNFYLYFVPSTGKAIYIPYDWDWCMGDFYGNYLSSSTPFSEYTISGDSPSGIYYSTFFKTNNNGHNVSYSRTSMQNRYIEFINAAVSKGVLNIDNFASLYEKIAGYTSSSEITRVGEYMDSKLDAYQLVD